MAIILVTGVPGSGKSYSAIQLCVLPALDLGRPIRTNIPLLEDEIRQVWPSADVDLINTDDPEQWERIPGGSLVVVDEVGNIWPAGERADRACPHAREFISMHRHRTGPVGSKVLSQEVVILSQGSKDIAAWVRSKVDKTYVIKKLDAIGADKRFRVDIYQGWQDTGRPLKRDHVRGYTGVYSPNVFRFYESHTQGQGESSGVSVQELRADRKATIWGSSTMMLAIAGPFILLFAAVMLYRVYGSMFGAGAASKLAETQDPAPKVLAVKPSLPAVVAPVKDLTPVLSESDWRLVGWVTLPSGYRLLIQRGSEKKRVTSKTCQLIGYMDLECQLEGKVITSRTGTIEQNKEQSKGILSDIELPSMPVLTANK